MYRVQKLLSKIGYCSRRSAEQLIESGKIKINDKIVSLGDKWYRGDIVKVNDKQIDLTLAFDQVVEIIKYYKPIGEVVSMRDLNTSGLILFTNNGDLANKIMHPSNNFDREYLVETDKPISQDSMRALLKGVPINDGQIGKFNHISKKRTKIYSIILSTGKNREIRNSLTQVSIKTISLHRIRYSQILIGDLKPGEYRNLNISERASFSI
jgi:pseudouridine synthase